MKLTEFMIECERRAYLAKGNPLHVWNAYSTARAKGIAVPEWVLRYFDKASWDLRALANEPEKKNLGPKIAKALDLVRDGRGTPFDYDTKWWVYGRKVREFVKRGDQLDHARSFAADEFGVSPSTIRLAANLYDATFPEDDDELTIDEDDLPDFD